MVLGWGVNLTSLKNRQVERKTFHQKRIDSSEMGYTITSTYVAILNVISWAIIDVSELVKVHSSHMMTMLIIRLMTEQTIGNKLFYCTHKS